MTRGARFEYLILGGLLLLALALRVYRLDAPLWYDEILTLTHFVREPWGALVTDFSSLNNHMLYSIEAKLATGLLGESAWTFRLPAMLFGVGSLYILWLLARPFVSARVALIAVGLCAISYHHVWFSQNARGYTELLFLTSLATLLFIRGMNRPGWGIWTAYGVTIAACMYTHLSAGFFLAAHGVVALVMLLKDWRGFRPVYGFALGGVITLALHAPIFSQVFSAMNKVSEGKDTSQMAEWVNPLRMLTEISYSLGALGPLAPVALLGGLLVIVVGAVALVRRAPVLGSIYLLSIPIALAILVALSFRIWPRYFFVDIQFIFLAVAMGLEVLAIWFAKLIRQPAWGNALLAVAVVVAAAASALLLVRNYEKPKQDFAGAIIFINKNKDMGDVTTSLGLASEPLQAYLAPDWPVIRNETDLAYLQSRGAHVWIVTAFDDHVEADQTGIMDEIRRTYAEAGKFEGTLGGGTVRVWRSR
ncbi:MAG: glycosyltransferase family 39 protein [Sphingobium sp.]